MKTTSQDDTLSAISKQISGGGELTATLSELDNTPEGFQGLRLALVRRAELKTRMLLVMVKHLRKLMENGQ